MSKEEYAAADMTEVPRHRGKKIGTLWLDRSEMSGDVTITTDFSCMTALERADVLQDLVGVLHAEYMLAIAEMRISGMLEELGKMN